MTVNIARFRKLKSAAFNSELSKIYDECKPVFLIVQKNKYPQVSESDIEEIYNDSILALYNNVKNGTLSELTCSLQTYINRIGDYKVKDLLRKRHLAQESLTDYEAKVSCEKADELWASGTDDVESERKSCVYGLIERLTEPCRKILFGYYYDHFTMATIAELLGFASADVAKAQKHRCMNKFKGTVESEFKTNGLM